MVATNLLELKGLTKHFGGLAAVSDLDLELRRGEILGLIGPNGAGKTTVFNLVSGVLNPTSGRVIFDGEDITRVAPGRIAQKGLVRTFQATMLFHDYTVIDNVLIACHLHARIGFFGALFNTRYTRQREAELLDRAMEIVNFLGLADYRTELAKNLPHGHQRALGVAIALASEPKVLMLDEPVTGMNPVETETMMGHISQVRERGVTILLVEHDMRAVMGLCDRIAVLNFGRKIAEGSPEEIRANKDVIEAYLGVEGEVA